MFRLNSRLGSLIILTLITYLLTYRSILGLPIYLNNLPTLTTYLLTYLFTYPTIFTYLPCFVQLNNEWSFNLKIII